MSRICEVTGKAGLVGNMVYRWVTLRVSAAGLRTINKLGIQAVAQELGI